MKPYQILLAAPLAGLALAQGTPAPQQQAQLTPVPSAVQPSAPAPAQWVKTNAAFPPPPGPAPTSPQPVQQSSFGATSYGQATSAPTGAPAQNGVAPLPPLAPPTNMQQAGTVVSPFTGPEIIRLRKRLDQSRQAKAYRPVRTVPRVSSMSVDLSPGAALPIARMLPGEMSTLLFLDATGAPWPLAAAPRVSDGRYFDAEWLQGTPTVVISALSSYEDGNMTVLLQGLATPIVIKLASGEPDSRNTSRIVDYRLDLRIPGRGPHAQAPLLGPGKIALYDSTLQLFLDGLPPKEAKSVKPLGQMPARTQVWQMDGTMFVRTGYDIQTAFDQSIAAADGTRVYRLPPTPYITLSDLGRSITFQLDIE